jgi:glucose-1-phosphate thymidylyltransferase
MKVIILMAGLGTRLRPHTYSRPKALINVAGKPMIGHIMDALQALDIEEYICVVGYLGDQIERYIRKTYKVNARFVVQEQLLGQAHAIHLCKDYLEGPSIVLFSDTIFEANLRVLANETADAVAFVKEVEDPRRFGVIALNNQGFIAGFVEKPESMDNRLALIGLYYIRDSQAMIQAIEALMADEERMLKGEFYIADAFNIMVKEGARFRTEQVGAWLDCGKPETVLSTTQYLLAHGHDNSADFTHDTVVVIPPVHIDPTATIEHAVIGPNAVISAGCEIRNSIIRDSIVDEGAVVESVLIEESLVGQRARVSGRFRRLDVGDTSSVDCG